MNHKQQESLAKLEVETAKLTVTITGMKEAQAKPMRIRGTIRLALLWLVPFVTLWAIGITPEYSARIAVVPALGFASFFFAGSMFYWAVLLFMQRQVNEIKAKTEAIRVATRATCPKCGSGKA